jgi:hypothetical protein
MKFFKRKNPVDLEQALADKSSAVVDDELIQAQKSAAEVAVCEPEPASSAKASLLSRLRLGLGRTSDTLLHGLGTLYTLQSQNHVDSMYVGTTSLRHYHTQQVLLHSLVDNGLYMHKTQIQQTTSSGHLKVLEQLFLHS